MFASKDSSWNWSVKYCWLTDVLRLILWKNLVGVRNNKKKKNIVEDEEEQTFVIR